MGQTFVRSAGIQLLLFVLGFSGLLSSSGAAQSLSIGLESTSKALITATSPLGFAYRVQASADAENWLDLSDQASGAFTYWIDPTIHRERFFRLRTWPTDDLPINIVILGDSTVADFSSNSERFYGWGEGMHDKFEANVTLVNLATPGQSSTAFLSSSQRDALLLIRPEFVLVQFGMEDSDDPGNPISLDTYEVNLKSIVEIIRSFQGTPILITPLLPGYFEGGKVISMLKDVSASMRKVSKELQTYLIDLNQLSEDYFNQVGPTEAARLTWSAADRTHFSLAGAEVIAGIVVKALPTILSAQVAKIP